MTNPVRAIFFVEPVRDNRFCVSSHFWTERNGDPARFEIFNTREEAQAAVDKRHTPRAA